jgi:transposase InsO family protein
MNSQLMPDESGFSASDAMELSLEEAKRMGHCLDRHPIVLTDNGPAFKGFVLGDYLENRGMRHIYGRPYHPQTQGKVERVNRTFKDHIYVHEYNSPDELQKALRETADWYNNRPHEAHQNVSPNDVYAGRKEEILQCRAVKKKLTLEKRKTYNQGKDLGRKEK